MVDRYRWLLFHPGTLLTVVEATLTLLLMELDGEDAFVVIFSVVLEKCWDGKEVQPVVGTLRRRGGTTTGIVEKDEILPPILVVLLNCVDMETEDTVL